jgi:hypothetical protein
MRRACTRSAWLSTTPPGSDHTFATWQVDVLDQRGVAVQRWLGEAPLTNGRGLARLAFNGRHASGPALAAGFYTLRLRAVPSVQTSADASKTCRSAPRNPSRSRRKR